MREISTSLVACACTDIKASASGLTEGQLSGCHRRNLKNGCVARSEGKEPAPLTGAPSYRYFLTARGYGPWSAWVMPGSSARVT